MSAPRPRAPIVTPSPQISRSRLREVILGGMTHDVLENVTVPILMAH
ncbi:hypothetical protein [Azospirillum brasilense]|nr:hypothetical protein [Azospirillum brasilense]